jgi:thiol:disulfide interchange protein DsbA
MKCKDIDALLDVHGIGTLSAAAKADVAHHLRQCRRCADACLGHEALAGEIVAAPRTGFYAEALAAAVAGGDANAAAGEPMTAAAGVSRRRRAALGLAAAAVIAAGLAWLSLPGEQAAEQGAAPAVADDSAESLSPGMLGDTPVRQGGSYLPPSVQELLNRAQQAYVAGTHYARLAVPAPTTADAGRVEVCEFFMFGCIHCYDFEPILTSWVESRSGQVDFVRVPALFNDLAVLHAQAYYTAEALGAADDFVGPFYAAIHERGQSLASVAEIREFFVLHGVDGTLFDATFDSAEVRGDLRRAAELNRLYGVDATPTIGVAGKYRTNVSMAGSNEVLFDVVDSLVATELAEAASSESPPCDGFGCATSLDELLDEIRRLRSHSVPAEQGGERF